MKNIVPAFELNGRYFASADTTCEQLNNDLECILSIVDSMLGNYAFDMAEKQGSDEEPAVTSQALYGLQYLTKFAYGIGAELSHRRLPQRNVA